MIKSLCELIQRNQRYLNFSLSYTKITDWCIEVRERIRAGEDRELFSFQHCDLDKCAAEAYVKTTEWLSENKGGY